MKKITSLIITILCAVALFTGISKPVTAYAATGTISVTPDKGEVTVGENVTVDIYVKSTHEIYNGDFILTYDSSKLQFVSTDGTTGGSYDGAINFQIMMMGNFSTEYRAQVVFKAIQTGTVNFGISDGYTFVENTGDDPTIIKMTVSTSSLKISDVGSGDATLSSLSVVNYGLAPDFSPGTTSYKSYVGTDVTSVNISAIATQAAKGARTEVSGPTDALQYGTNIVTITSYAPNGSSMIYTIEIIRANPEPETEPEETEPAGEEINITINGNVYIILASFEKELLPEDYRIDLVTISGMDVMAAVNDKTKLTLVYLTDEEGKESFFIYSADDNSYREYISFSYAGNTYVYLADGISQKDIPYGVYGDYRIQDVTVKAYADSENESFIYFYGVNRLGERNIYCYDVKEETIQRVNSQRTGTESGTDSGNDYEDRIAELEKANSELNAQSDQMENSRNIIFIVGVITILILIIIIIIMAVHKSGKKHSIELEPDDELAEDFFADDISTDNSEAEAEYAVTDEPERDIDEAAVTEVEEVSENEKEEFNKEAYSVESGKWEEEAAVVEKEDETVEFINLDGTDDDFFL